MQTARSPRWFTVLTLALIYLPYTPPRTFAALCGHESGWLPVA